NFNINDRFSYHAEKSSRNQKFKTNSILVNYNYYFGGKTDANGSGYVVSPFMKYRFGNFEEDRFNDVSQKVELDKVDMNSFIFG
ncbi:hypothetical protein J0J24_24505, partial [Vibrio vulnificus]|nr:hypothetical protein [Vibrio vulnificus]